MNNYYYFGKISIHRTIFALCYFTFSSIAMLLAILFFYYELTNFLQSNRMFPLEIVLPLLIYAVLRMIADKCISIFKLDNIVIFNILIIFPCILIFYIHLYIESHYQYDNNFEFLDIQSVLLYKINTLNHSFESDIPTIYGPVTYTFPFIFNYIFIIAYTIVFLKFKGYKYLDDLVNFGDNRATLNCYVSDKKIKMRSIEEVRYKSNEIKYEDRYKYMHKYVYVIVSYKGNLYKISRVKKRFGKVEYNNKYLYLKEKNINI